MSHPWAGVAALVVNILVTAFTLALIKKNVSEEDLEKINQAEEEDIDLDDIKVI